MSNKVKYVILAVVAAAAAVVLFRAVTGGGNQIDLQASADRVPIVCTETGETWTIEQAFIMQGLYSRPYPLDPDVGLSSPANDGQPTGFPEDRRLWEQMIEVVNREKRALIEARDTGENRPTP